MMHPVVAKFGGTSVANVSALEHCADIILSSPDIKVVVVSAQSGVTNLLVKLAKALKQPVDIKALIQEIQSIVMPIAEYINLPAVYDKLQKLLSELMTLGQISTRMYNQQIADEILSFGERISAMLVSEFLARKHIPTKYIPAKWFMKTDSHHGQAKPDTKAISQQAAQAIYPYVNEYVVVTEGFIGSDEQGNTTTLGRGGSDFSGALISEAIGAKSLQIWTDVNGIYQVDPRTTSKACVIDSLSFNEAAELATFGAKVLHPATLWPAIRANIHVFVGSTFSPKQGGSWITPKQKAVQTPVIRAIAERKNQTLLTIKSFDMFHAKGFLARVFSVLSKHNIGVDLVTTSEVSIALTLDNTTGCSTGDSLLTPALLAELKALGQVDIQIQNGLSLVAVIGNQLNETKGISGALFACLKNYNIRLFCHGASGHNICMLVDTTVAKQVIEKIYQTFLMTNNMQEVSA